MKIISLTLITAAVALFSSCACTKSAPAACCGKDGSCCKGHVHEK